MLTRMKPEPILPGESSPRTAPEPSYEYWQRFFAGGIPYRGYLIKEHDGFVYRWNGISFGVSSSVAACRQAIDELHGDL
jgi:hypothetical protein